MIENQRQIIAAVQSESDNIFALAVRIVNDRDAAKDITQDTFIKVMEKYPDVRDKDRLRALLIRTAYNLALNTRRNNKNREKKASDIAAMTDRPGFAENNILKSFGRLESALKNLAERQQEVIRLRFYGNCKISDIAAILDVADGTVKVHLARGLRNLKKILTGETRKER